ncbi:META domain-containing protein [Epilithonimonas zeae]|uniref:META domain-containing protein n=1 Tax=Epilithonimonas zeae TaxID=1416779 RepID=UPI00200E2F27|nr:META domain-containing protein [Epilithonimonas zeae]UQB68171.1 META domain-containing protein [Epilithonimonas zeae]
MKFLKSIGVLSLLMLLLISCNSSKKVSESMGNINRKWMLVEYKDFTKAELTKLEANMDLTKRAEAPNQYGAKMGCNGMFFTAELNKGKAKFSGVGSTMMYCDGRMKLEVLFGKELPTMDQYKIEGHFLTLSNGNGDKMKFVAADWD